MNSCIDLVITGVENSIAEVVCNELELRTRVLEGILSCFYPEAETFRVNQRAFFEKVTISNILLDFMTECVHYNKLTSGYFDVGLGNFKPSLRKQPENPACGMKYLELDVAHKTISFTSDAVALDFGAIGKGWLLREASKILNNYTVENCFLSVGGSSILTRGRHPHGTSWPVTSRIDLPDYPVFYLNNHCASFSGAWAESSDLYHIIHPQSLTPVTNGRFTFVQTECPAEAEVLSTSLLIAEVDQIESITALFKPIKAIVFCKKDNQELTMEYSYERNS